MRKDPIVAEVQEIRQWNAAKFDFDVKAIAEDARRRESQSGHRLVSPPPRQKIQ